MLDKNSGGLTKATDFCTNSAQRDFFTEIIIETKQNESNEAKLDLFYCSIWIKASMYPNQQGRKVVEQKFIGNIFI